MLLSATAQIYIPLPNSWDAAAPQAAVLWLVRLKLSYPALARKEPQHYRVRAMTRSQISVNLLNQDDTNYNQC
jgi:hypothetical protein